MCKIQTIKFKKIVDKKKEEEKTHKLKIKN